MKVVLAFISICLLSLSCQDDVLTAESPRIRKLVADRIQLQYEQKIATCRQEAIDLAEQRVDSIFRANPLKVLADTISLPPIPEKPQLPHGRRPRDSARVKPFLPGDTIR